MTNFQHVRIRLEKIVAQKTTSQARPAVCSALLILSLLVSSPSMALNLESLASPRNTQLSWVGKNIVQNGMPMQIVELRSAQSLQAVLAFYRQDWRQYHQPGVRSDVSNELDGWSILSTLIDEHNVVLQIKTADGYTQGYISATPLDRPTQQGDVAKRFPKQWGTKLVSATESTDGGVTATTLVLQSALSVPETQRFYKTALLNKGWKLSRSSQHANSSVMLFDKRKGSMELAMRRENNKTIIFANVKGGV